MLLPLRATVLDPPRIWRQYSEIGYAVGTLPGAGAIAVIGAMTIRSASAGLFITEATQVSPQGRPPISRRPRPRSRR
jgi:hypothetical protein